MSFFCRKDTIYFADRVVNLPSSVKLSDVEKYNKEHNK